MSERSAIIRLAQIVEDLAHQLGQSAHEDGDRTLSEVFIRLGDEAAEIRKGAFGA